VVTGVARGADLVRMRLSGQEFLNIHLTES